MNSIGQQIKKYRLEAKMSQKELGEKIGVSQQQIAQYENGKRIPKIDTVNDIAGALNMGIRRLYPGFTFEEWRTSDTFKGSIKGKLERIGIGLYRHSDKDVLYLEFSDGILDVTDEELKYLEKSTDDYLKFKVEELKNKKCYKGEKSDKE